MDENHCCLCLSAKDNSSLNLFVYHLTTLTRWIGKRVNKWCQMFLLLIKLAYDTYLIMSLRNNRKEQDADILESGSSELKKNPRRFSVLFTKFQGGGFDRVWRN